MSWFNWLDDQKRRHHRSLLLFLKKQKKKQKKPKTNKTIIQFSHFAKENGFQHDWLSTSFSFSSETWLFLFSFLKFSLEWNEDNFVIWPWELDRKTFWRLGVTKRRLRRRRRRLFFCFVFLKIHWLNLKWDTDQQFIPLPWYKICRVTNFDYLTSIRLDARCDVSLFSLVPDEILSLTVFLKFKTTTLNKNKTKKTFVTSLKDFDDIQISLTHLTNDLDWLGTWLNITLNERRWQMAYIFGYYFDQWPFLCLTTDFRLVWLTDWLTDDGLNHLLTWDPDDDNPTTMTENKRATKSHFDRMTSEL